VRKVIICVSLLMVIIWVASFAYCQEAAKPPEAKILDGQIILIDWMASLIVVKWLPPPDYSKTAEITLFVPEDAVIIRGSEPISLTDLEVGDRVIVSYYDTSKEIPIVSRIMVYYTY
jgi:hypothetical protein